MGTTLVYSGGGIPKFVPVLNEGERLVVDTSESWRYHFRISKSIKVHENANYFVEETDKNRLILIDSVESNYMVVVEADLLNTEKL